MVSNLSIIGMSFSLLVSLLLTLGLFLFLRMRLGLKVIPTLVGTAAFFIFVFVLESALHSIVLKRAPDGSVEMMKQPFMFVLYAALAAGVFEETARFLSFHLLKRKYNGFSTAISYGIGHGGIEVLLLVTLSMVSNIFISVTVNAGMAESLGSTPEILNAVNTLIETAPGLFFVSGVERIPAVVVQISLSVLVWHSVNTKGRVWLYPAAIGLHALVDVVPAMYQCGVITSILVVEIVLVVVATLVALITIRTRKKIKTV